FKLPELPFDKSSLKPYLSEESFDYHHGKHHQAYVTNLNKLIENNSEFNNGVSLETIIIKASNKESLTSIFNNAAQVWNHSFFWHCLSPKGGGVAIGELADKINEDFG